MGVRGSYTRMDRDKEKREKVMGRHYVYQENSKALEVLRAEREMSELRTEHKLMRKALEEIAGYEGNEHAKWVLQVLFGVEVKANGAK